MSKARNRDARTVTKRGESVSRNQSGVHHGDRHSATRKTSRSK
jgi:hypothetical protein